MKFECKKKKKFMYRDESPLEATELLMEMEEHYGSLGYGRSHHPMSIKFLPVSEFRGFKSKMRFSVELLGCEASIFLIDGNKFSDQWISVSHLVLVPYPLEESVKNDAVQEKPKHHDFVLDIADVEIKLDVKHECHIRSVTPTLYD